MSQQRSNADVRTAVAYIRVSTEEQAKGGVSLNAQEERLHAYCKAAGLELVCLIREEGVSGAKPLSDREGGQRLLRLIQKDKAHHIVAMKLDRLFRDCEDALRQTREWDRSNVALHLVDMGGQSMNTASAMGRMMLTMMAGFAELERNLIAERTTTAMRHLKSKKQAYSPTPFGFRRIGDILVSDDAEQKVVALIQARRDEGQTLAHVADQLNAELVPTKKGGSWTAMTVRRILLNDLHTAP